MEVAIKDGQIIIPEEVLKKAHLPKKGKCKLEIREREIRIFTPFLKKKEQIIKEVMANSG